MRNALLAMCALGFLAMAAGAQDIEPRSYSNAPIGVNGSLMYGPTVGQAGV